MLRYRNNSILFSLSIILLWSCESSEDSNLPEPLVRELSTLETEIATSSNNFTFDLMTELEKDIPDENYFISSFSVSTALSMVLNGATESSQEEFIRTLGLEGMSVAAINESYQSLVTYIYGLDPSITLSVANSNWYSDEYTIGEDFANALKTYYEAAIFGSDFSNPETLDRINEWIEDETNGKIKDALDRISPDEVMFLINTIYFKAHWTSQFDPDKTTDLSFTLPTNQSVDVPTMVAEVKHWWSYDNTLKAQVIEIPYGNENYAFTVIMPDEVSDINGLVSKIEVDHLNSVLADSSTLARDLHLPKFKLGFKKDLLSILQTMGMPTSGLDNLFEEPLPLAISQVIHQSYLEVNEEGSEAAAVTIIGVELTSTPAATRINKPFVFLIRERNSGTILFSGKLLDPR